MTVPTAHDWPKGNRLLIICRRWLAAELARRELSVDWDGGLDDSEIRNAYAARDRFWLKEALKASAARVLGGTYRPWLPLLW